MRFLLLIITLCHCFVAVGQASSSSKKQLQFCYCSDSLKSKSLELDTLLLVDGFFFQHLQTSSPRGQRNAKLQENDNCITYSVLLPTKTYHYYYINTYTLDSLSIHIHLSQDTVIDLNALAHNYYQKVSTQISLLDDIKAGDKISLAYSYNDCPTYQSSFFITLLALSVDEFKILSSSNNKRAQKQATVQLTALQNLEKNIRGLESGKSLKIQIRKNNCYQVLKRIKPSYSALSTLLQEFQALYQGSNPSP